MRLFSKIFICSAFILSMTILFSGYLLITYSYENAIAREKVYAMNQYQYDKFAIQSGLIANGTAGEEQEEISLLVEKIAKEFNHPSALFYEDKSLAFSSLPHKIDLEILDAASCNQTATAFREINETVYIVLCGKIIQNETPIYLLTISDISNVTAQKEIMMKSFVKVYVMTLCVSMTAIFIFSLFLTTPIKKLDLAAKRIAGGDYSERILSKRSDELGALSDSFNQMAEEIESKIEQLSLAVRQKEDFIASFAHELKTPLTSVIGYADMIYQKNLSPEEIKSSAWYILNEGLRLESLSFKLMELIIMDKQDFMLEEMPADQLLLDVFHSIKPILDEKGITVRLEADEGNVKAEYDLFKTLMLNLVDNAVKAGSDQILISGKRKEGRYNICVSDNGSGIPEPELERITEAFYMVDKARSRKQHGVGLGLSLAARIAEIHKSSLSISSMVGEGTTIRIELLSERGEIGEKGD